MYINIRSPYLYAVRVLWWCFLSLEGFFYNVKVEAVFEKGNACDSGNGDRGIMVRVLYV